MPKTSMRDVASGLLADALISYIAIMREKGYAPKRAVETIGAWTDACSDMAKRAMALAMTEHTMAETQVDALLVSLDQESPDDHLEAVIEERRALVRDTMHRELDDIEDAGPPPPGREDVRD